MKRHCRRKKRRNNAFYSMEIKKEDLAPIELDLSVLHRKPLEELREVSMLEYVKNKFDFEDELALLKRAQDDYDKMDKKHRKSAEEYYLKPAKDVPSLSVETKKAMTQLQLIDQKKMECWRLRAITLQHLQNIKKFDDLLAKLAA